MGSVLRRLGGYITVGLLIAAVLAFLLLAVGPRVFGYQTYTMLTGSMAPMINAGDVVITVPVDADDVQVGDVITYHIPIDDQRVETHRVVEVIDQRDGATAVRTKGDANESVDPWTAVLGGDVVDQHALTIPNLGSVIRVARQPIVMNALMYGAPAALVVGALVSIWRRDQEEPQGRKRTDEPRETTEQQGQSRAPAPV